MINLIPIEEKVRINREFCFRLLSVSFLTFGLLFLISCVVIFPSYVFLMEKKTAIDLKLDLQKKEPVPEIDQKALNIIEDLNKKIETVDKSQKERYDISTKIIKEILLRKIAGIKLTQIYYSVDELGEKRISMSGVASDRAHLLDFRKSLEADTSFSKVNLPISNFVKDSDIEFNLTLVPS